MPSLQEWMANNPQNIEVKNLQLILSNLDSVQERFSHVQDLDHSQQQAYQQHIDNLNLLRRHSTAGMIYGSN